MNKILSILLYLIIIICSTIFASLSQRKVMSNPSSSSINVYIFNKKWYVLSFLCVALFICFSNKGIDYNNYYHIINTLTWKNYENYLTSETVFNIICLCLRFIFNNSHICILALKFLILFFAYASFYLLKEQLNVGLSVFAYLSICYLPSFYLLSIMLACSLIMVAVALYINSRKIGLSVIFIIIATLIHNSGIIFLLIFLFYLIYNKSHIKIVLIILSLIAILIFYLFSDRLFVILQNIIPNFHYYSYGVNSYSGSGLFIFVRYIPLFIFSFFLLVKLKQKDSVLASLIEVFLLGSFMLRIMAYKFIVIERADFYFNGLYTMLFPICFRKIENEKIYSFKSIILIVGFYFIYIVFLLYLSINQYVNANNGLANYEFFNPFIV